MKGRESGMPEETHWASFFDAEKAILALLGPRGVRGNVLELGCGYGTFTLPAARRTSGWVTALDIEPEMVAEVRRKAAEQRLTNVRPEVRDFVSDGSGVNDASQAHVMIYNLLHLEKPVDLLVEAKRTLCSGGVLSVMHWRSDIVTPRGPPMDIRPHPHRCSEWIRQAGFHSIQSVDLDDCCPFHFGLIGIG